MPETALPTTSRPRRVYLAEPNGYCAGVYMAVKALVWMVQIFDAPVYC
ncbi:MAG: 4-hydroxy-3-methylbut-2-enyl diphosphate reductase, partial [Acidimicrobiia bacterium]|nr:4-hydroxy-3-methylbut-2-enyl diphosphate reductase [Acidimicrobiia bacterium]